MALSVDRSTARDLRRRAGERGVRLAGALRAAALDVLARWNRVPAGPTTTTFRERATSEPTSPTAPCAVTLELDVDGARSTLPVDVELPSEGFTGELTHRVRLDGDDALTLELTTATPPTRQEMLDDLLEAEAALLARLASDGSAWNAKVPLRLPARLLAAREDANATAAPITEDLLQDGFLQQARERPDDMAVLAGAVTLTYSELRARVAHLAARLRALGARRDRPVAVVMEKGWQQVVAVLGILEAGSFYLPVDPALPPARTKFLLENGEAELAVTQPRVAAAFEWPASVRERLLVEEPPPSNLDAGSQDRARPDDLAYLIFTSGSTGTPKGVAITHRAAVNTIRDVNRRFGVRAGDRVLAISALNFDLSVWDVFGLLAAGGTVVLPDAARAKDPRHWAQVVTDAKVTVWNSVPALMDLLVQDLAFRHRPLPPTLRLAMLSGDWIPLDLPARMRGVSRALAIVSLGGATEAAIWSNFYPVEDLDPSWRSIPYGRPLANQRFHVLDADLEPCPTWVPGQLFIAGAGLAREYWKEPEKTKKAFFLHPQTGERLYRTGDLGRYLPSGDLEFLGREDGQVKLRGHRIELAEIERALLAHRSVARAVALFEKSPTGGRIVAFVIDAMQRRADVRELEAFLRGRLPGYVVPAAIVPVDAIPLTANAKIDRAALFKLAAERPASDAPVADPPRDDLERSLAKLFEQVLGRSGIGRRDNFFEVGGDSFNVLELLNRIEQTFQRKLPIRALTWAPTIERIAEVLRTDDEDEPTSLATIRPKGPRGAIFCVHSGDGEIVGYRQLASHLHEIGLYGFQSERRLDGSAVPHTIEEMAARYVDEMRAFQPQGPYHVAGHSLGGVVALEMARQLAAQGQEVPLVALLETSATVCLPRIRTMHDHLSSLRWKVSHHAHELATTPTHALHYVAEHAAVRAQEGLERARGLLRRSHGTANGGLTPREAFRLAAASYVPARYDGPVVAFRTLEGWNGPWEDDPAMGWAEWLPNVEFVRVPGGHLSMLTEPHVAKLAEELERAFVRASAKKSPSGVGSTRARVEAGGNAP